MAKEMVLSGLAASAQAAKLAKIEVACSYPIRPYTALMMELAKMVANGELDCEFIHGEGEHGQLSVVLGAAAQAPGPSPAAPAWASPMRSRRTPRSPAAGAPTDVHRGPGPGSARRLRFGAHGRHVRARPGLAHGWAETPQEALDNSLINYRVGEDHRVLLPQFVCQDGYSFLTSPARWWSRSRRRRTSSCRRTSCPIRWIRTTRCPTARRSARTRARSSTCSGRRRTWIRRRSSRRLRGLRADLRPEVRLPGSVQDRGCGDGALHPGAHAFTARTPSITCGPRE